MHPISRRMDNPINWSFAIGSLFGIRIRVHVLFILMGLALLLMNRAPIIVSFGSLTLLFLVVLLHEFGHCFGARRVGGGATEILMWPLGGLATVQAPMTSRAQLITTAAGPLVNVVFCVVTAAILMMGTGKIASVPWNPLAPFGMASVPNSLWWWLGVFFGVNYIILLFNLLPVYPLDGGRMLQCMLWPSMGLGRATEISTFVGMIGAIVIGLAGLATRQFMLLFIAMFGYLTCYQQRQMLKAGMLYDEGEFGYDFSQGYASLEADDQEAARRPSWFARRRQARAERKAETDRKRQLDEKQRVDAILRKVSKEGVGSLTPNEKRVLQEETRRKHSD